MEAVGGISADTGEAGIGRRYAALGYELSFPDDVLRLAREELKQVAAGVTEVFDEVYHRRPELSAKRTRQLIDDVADGRVLLFLLRDRARAVVATMAFTQVESVFSDSPVSLYEAGRAAKRFASPPRLATDLIRAGFIWAARRLEGDYMIAEARVACAEKGRPFNGRSLARVLECQNFIPAHAAYSHYVAQTTAEPFVWACAATDAPTWHKAVEQQTVYLPVGAESRLFAAMLAENCATHVEFTGSGSSDGSRDGSGDRSGSGSAAGRREMVGEIRELTGPSPTNESLYVLTGHPITARRVVQKVPAVTQPNGAQVSAGLSDRLFVEEDIVGRPDSARVLHVLRQEGFALAGWAPSHRRYGRLALVLTRPGTVPAKSIHVAPPDLSALAHLPATHRFLTRVLSRRPSPEPCDVARASA